jgi:TM2 domain-containing membrane protein YozV
MSRTFNTKRKKMEAQKVDMFIMSNSKYFESYQLNGIRERLLAIDDSKWAVISTLQLKDPTTSLIISILVGHFGIDRFIIGDTGLGIGKLLTCGGLGIWTIVDWFLIQGATREKNMEKIQPFLY